MVVAHGRPIDEIVEATRRRLTRLSPAEAHDAMRDGAILVDIRPARAAAGRGQRARMAVRSPLRGEAP